MSSRYYCRCGAALNGRGACPDCDYGDQNRGNDLPKPEQLIDSEQCIADLEAQLAASEAAAAVMRQALELVIDWADIGMNKKYRPMTLGGVRMMLKLAAEKALATDHGKAAAERLAKLERVAEAAKLFVEWAPEQLATRHDRLVDALKALEE